MKIALITPYAFSKKDYRFSPHPGLDILLRNNFGRHLSRRPNLALLTLAHYLNDRFEIDYLDEQYEEVTFEKHYDIVAISIMTVNAYRGYKIAEEFKKCGSYVIIGGIHATLMPQEVKKHADTVIVGEGEEAWQTFLKDFEQKKPQPFYYGTGLMDLNQSPLPRYDLLPSHFFYNSLFKKEVYSYQFSRGCPHRCSFCSSSKAYGPRYRTKSVEHYLKGVEQAMKRSGNEGMIFFADDDVTVKRNAIKPILEGLAEYHTSWIGCTDIAIAEDEDLMNKITKSGCKLALIGLESLDPTSLQTIDAFKAKYFKDYDETIKRIVDHGIPLFASFIVGFDNDDKGSFDRIYNFATKHRIPMTSVVVLTPLPGTAIYQQLKNEGRLLYEDFWDKCTGMYPLFKPKKLTIDELLEGTYQLNLRLSANLKV